ncbi:hypothetical protein J2793_007022 [Paraburkholderia caledonica]|uniref:Uncharacterized protein n=1 Tax=Paraburkholderia caledonica TaxID=134536 RepID=A0AB73ING3_9BURK|nr:hypothetical protein [Paraburkholderia caledonica]
MAGRGFVLVALVTQSSSGPRELLSTDTDAFLIETDA